MSRTNWILLIIFGYILFVLIIIYPGLSQYPSTTGWGAGIDYGRQYIVDHGHISPTVHIGTWQGLLSNYGSQDVISKIEFATINLITGTVSSEDGVRFLNIVKFSKILLMPLFGIYVHHWLTKGRPRELRDMALIGLFAMMPLASSLPISQDGGVAGNSISMALLLPILVLMITENHFVKRVILFLLVFIFLMLWHTWSLYFLIMCIALLIGALINKDAKLRFNTFCCIVAYLAVGLYLNYDQLIGYPGAIIQSILNIDSFQLVLSFTSNDMAYRTGESAYSLLQIFASASIIGIIAYATLKILLKGKAQRSMIERSIVWLSIGLGFCWVSLFLLGGTTTLMARVLEPSIPISIICASYLLAESRTRCLPSPGRVLPADGKKIASWSKLCSSIVPMVLVTLITMCAISHLIAPPTPLEFYGAEPSSIGFIGASGDITTNYFSDFRLGATLIVHDMHNIFTIDKQTQQGSLFEDLLGIYYDNTDPSTPLVELISDDHFVITSRYQSIMGVVDPNQNLIGARSGFEDNFFLSDSYHNLYNNGDSRVWAYVP